MSILNMFTKTKSMPTEKQDYVAYAQGANSEYTSTYNDYVESVEAIDKAIRVIANIASSAKFVVEQEMVSGTTRPLKLKNVDFKYNTNDQSSQGDLLAMLFGSIFTQGAAIVLTSDNKQTKYKNFFSYDVSRFKVYATENNLFDSFVYSSEGGQDIVYKPSDLIYIAPKVGSSNLVYAISRLKSLNDMLTLQSSIMGQSNAYYASGGKQSAIISPKEPMGAEKASQLKTAFDSFLQTPATKTLFINSDVDVKTVSNAQSPKELLEALTQINNLIIEQFGIPLYLFGNYEGYVNDGAVVTATRIFFQVHMKPIFDSIAYQFTRYFRNTLKLKGAVVSFNYSDIEILADNLDLKIEQASKQYKLGLISLNEARVMCEHEPLPDEAANLHMLPAYLVSDNPISIERYNETMKVLLRTDTSTSTLPKGSSGGEDNTNLINDSRGGSGNTGE